jgi:8-amino-7-oxononanoate synthase
LAKKYGALLFVDDAHGFGVVGENPSDEYPYGHRGNGLVNYFGLNYDNIVYVGCFSKAYGSFGAFIACSKQLRDFLISQATPHDLGGAGPASSMCAVQEGLLINEEQGDHLRQRINTLTQRAVDGLTNLGYRLQHSTKFPIIAVMLGRSEHIIEISEQLYNDHILLTLAPYPMVAKGHEVLRITVTASNTDEEVDQLILAFAKLKPFLEKHGYLFESENPKNTKEQICLV